MIDFNRNNLVDDNSPYLNQHKNNPVNWQTWSKSTLEQAKKLHQVLDEIVGAKVVERQLPTQHWPFDQPTKYEVWCQHGKKS